MNGISEFLNRRAAAVCDLAALNAELYGIKSSSIENLRILDFGTDRVGQRDAGILLSRICMSDLAKVRFGYSESLGMPTVQVETDHPLWSCIASQYAGWPLSNNDFFAMVSGPARMSRGKEELLKEYQLEQRAPAPVAVFESAHVPDSAACRLFREECQADHGTICVARTSSLPGSVQIVARSVETAMHKMHELGFDLRKIKSAFGVSPFPPIAPDDLTSLGWTNDAILYGGQVAMWVSCRDEELLELGPKIPSCASSSFGQPFLKLFKESDYDFYKMDKMLFSPAQITLNNTNTGSTFVFGRISPDVLHESFAVTSTS